LELGRVFEFLYRNLSQRTETVVNERLTSSSVRLDSTTVASQPPHPATAAAAAVNSHPSSIPLSLHDGLILPVGDVILVLVALMTAFDVWAAATAV